VVLLVEGPTEMELVPRAMDVLGIPRRPSFIRIVNAGGADRDHAFLAQYVTVPSLGPRDGDVATFERPPTHFVVVVDADVHKFRTPAAREATRLRWVRLLHGSLASDYQTPAAFAELDSLVRVEAWQDGTDFERAHFTDRELASGLARTGLMPSGVSAFDLESALRQARRAGRPIDAVWSGWGIKPDKPSLLLAMWPQLEQRLLDAASDRQRLRGIPLARILLDAYELAVRTPRRHVVFRLGDPPDSSNGDLS
jgi:hypothetical protein